MKAVLPNTVEIQPAVTTSEIEIYRVVINYQNPDMAGKVGLFTNLGQIIVDIPESVATEVQLVREAVAGQVATKLGIDPSNISLEA